MSASQQSIREKSHTAVKNKTALGGNGSTAFTLKRLGATVWALRHTVGCSEARIDNQTLGQCPVEKKHHYKCVLHSIPGGGKGAEDTPDVSHDSWIEKYRAVCVRSAGISRAAANEACGARGANHSPTTHVLCVQPAPHMK